MLKRAVRLSVVLAVATVVLGCREGPQPGATTQANAPAATSQPAVPAARPAAPAPVKPSAGQEEVVLTLTLPPKGEKLATEALSGHSASCPQTAVSGLLGVAITSPHGVVIGKVLPDGLGAKAGLKPGDSIIKVEGEAVTCPRAFVPFLSRTDKPREVKLTVIRAKATAAQAPPTGSVAEKPAGK